MAKTVVKYLLWGKDGQIPDFIENGGYLINSDNEMVGVTVDDVTRFVPSTAIVLSKADMIARALELMKDQDTRQAFSQQQAEDFVNALLSEFGIPDYA